MTLLKKLGLLLPPAKRVEAGALLVSVVIFAWIEVAWVAAIFLMMNASMDLVAHPENIASYRLLLWISGWYGAKEPREVLMIAGLGVIAVIVLRNAWGVFVTWQRAHFVKTAEAVTMLRLLRSYMSQPYAYFLDKNSAALSKNILSEVPILVSVSVLSMINILIDAATCLALIGYLVWQNPMVTITAMAGFAALLGALYVGVRLKLKAMGAEGRGVEEGMFRAGQEALGGIKDVKVLGRENHFLERFARYADTKARLHIESTVLKESPRYAVEAIAFVGVIGAMLYVIGAGAGLVELTGLLVLYGVAGLRLIPAMFRIYNGVSSFNFAQAVFDAIADDLAIEREGGIPNTHVVPLPLHRGICFEAVQFRYPTSSGPVLDDLNFEIKANTSVAFVGSTGAGKTTLIDMVLGLLRPTEGTISVDGVSIKGDAIRAWRAAVGYVPQHIFLADTSILNNIAFGRDQDEIDRAMATEAAKVAHIHDFVETLPNGYKTEIGERGVRLSGGQRQRVGIARALYHQPSVLIMDEATSALDGITENVISEAIRELHGRLTMIIVAHRLTTVRHCDRIFMMESGRIADQGTYGELLTRNAKFRAMAGAGYA